MKTELQQLHDRGMMEAKKSKSLTYKQKQEALAYLMFLKQKHCGRVKGRGCADGRKQKAYLQTTIDLPLLLGSNESRKIRWWMKSSYAVHEDFAHYPSFPFPFNGWVTSLLNGFLHLDTFFRMRKIKNKSKLHFVTSDDGSVFKVYQFNPDNASDNEKLPAIVYYHGGAFVLTYALG